jgi:hypothetical protein
MWRRRSRCIATRPRSPVRAASTSLPREVSAIIGA